LCHCRSCRRASGGTNVAWTVFDRKNFRWLWLEHKIEWAALNPTLPKRQQSSLNASSK
jgi:hypothetical protein